LEAKVKIFTLPTCPYCKMTKDLLEAKGVEYINHDVSADQEAMAEMQRISGGARTVPVVAVGREVIVGFDQTRLEQALKRLEPGGES